MESAAQPEPVTVARPKRRWLQFGTRALLVVVTALCVALGVIGRRVDRQVRLVAAIEAKGGRVEYADSGLPSLLVGLISLLGAPQDWTHDVVGVDLDGLHFNDTDLLQLRELPKLRKISMFDANITGDALVQFVEVHQLDYLESWNCHRPPPEFPGPASLWYSGASLHKVWHCPSLNMTQAD